MLVISGGYATAHSDRSSWPTVTIPGKSPYPSVTVSGAHTIIPVATSKSHCFPIFYPSFQLRAQGRKANMCPAVCHLYTFLGGPLRPPFFSPLKPLSVCLGFCVTVAGVFTIASSELRPSPCFHERMWPLSTWIHSGADRVWTQNGQTTILRMTNKSRYGSICFQCHHSGGRWVFVSSIPVCSVLHSEIKQHLQQPQEW